MRILLISGMPCEIDLIDKINSLKFDYIIGLGDIECPQYLRNFYGILGEADSVYVLKYLKKNGKLIETEKFNFSVDFSTPNVISHFPPEGCNTARIKNFLIGYYDIYNKIVRYNPKTLFHGHSESQGVCEIGVTKVVSVGLLKNGKYVMYDNGYIYFENF
jgi:Icc-related predicted phosphoesterase